MAIILAGDGVATRRVTKSEHEGLCHLRRSPRRVSGTHGAHGTHGTHRKHTTRRTSVPLPPAPHHLLPELRHPGHTHARALRLAKRRCDPYLPTFHIQNEGVTTTSLRRRLPAVESAAENGEAKVLPLSFCEGVTPELLRRDKRPSDAQLIVLCRIPSRAALRGCGG